MVEAILLYQSLVQVYFLHNHRVELGRFGIFCLTCVVENQRIIAFRTEEVVHFPLIARYLFRNFSVGFNGQWEHNALALQLFVGNEVEEKVVEKLVGSFWHWCFCNNFCCRIHVAGGVCRVCYSCFCRVCRLYFLLVTTCCDAYHGCAQGNNE